jgi:hypothetical protein
MTSAQSASGGLPDSLEAPLAIVRSTYPKLDGRRFPKAPADSVWIFRAPSSSVGTVEVGFEGAEVVYMIFRRGLNGKSWTLREIKALHIAYHRELLKETYDPFNDYFSRYDHSVASKISAGLITRKDFDPAVLLVGM